ncbi:hypothetical protein ACTHPF_27305 [Paenibacillus sp. SAF-054]|uniref:hypothetical protein n=1 Tax=Paenibacillus sp. SAF-054 TaxID=3436863 RepID=UPI003F813191
MIRDISELLRLVQMEELLEHSYPNVELKREWKKSVGEEVSALGNKLTHESFWLVIGVEDNGKLSKKNDKWVKQTEESISQQFNACLDPIQTSQSITCHCVNDSYIIVIQIINPGSVVRWEQIAYKASGTTVSKMVPEEEMELTIKLPGLSDYSSQIWNGEIDREIAKEFIESLVEKRREFAYNDSENEDVTLILDRLHISKTNVSNILFGNVKYRVVFYDRSGEIVKNEVRKGLYSVLTNTFYSEIQNFCSENTDERFPERAFKEAIANAVAHAAYFENNGDLIIEVYENQVCISNLCLPQSVFFANKWFSRSHKTVNNLLMETLRTCGIVDELGRGKNLIFSHSLLQGKKPPEVIIEQVGRFNRWKIYIHGGKRDEIQVRLLDRLRELYKNDQKALIANALVLWRDKTVTEIKKYIDGESAPLFVETLNDLRGPIFYYKEKDKITTRRWAEVLLSEGKDSRRFTQAEEEDLKELAYKIHSKYNNFLITPKELRGLAGLTNTKSEQTLISNLLKKWVSEGIIIKVKKGTYKFNKVIKINELSNFEELMRIFRDSVSEASSAIESLI